MKMKILYPILILAISSLACNVTVQTPKIKTGPETTTPISEDYPETSETPHLILKMGAGSLKISDGGTKMVEGEIKTNIATWQPKVNRSDEDVTISQGKNDQAFTFPSGDLINRLGTETGY